MESAFYLTMALFSIGLYGVLSRTNLLVILMSLEIMFNSTLILLAAATSYYGRPDGVIFFLVIIAIAACEVALGLSIAVAVFRKVKGADISLMKELSE